MKILKVSQKSNKITSGFLRGTLGASSWKREHGDLFQKVSISDSDKWCGDRNLKIRSQKSQRVFDFPLGEVLQNFEITEG